MQYVLLSLPKLQVINEQHSKGLQTRILLTAGHNLRPVILPTSPREPRVVLSSQEDLSPGGCPKCNYLCRSKSRGPSERLESVGTRVYHGNISLLESFCWHRCCCFQADGAPLQIFSQRLSEEMVKLLNPQCRKTAIFECEFFAVAYALLLWATSVLQYCILIIMR